MGSSFCFPNSKTKDHVILVGSLLLHRHVRLTVVFEFNLMTTLRIDLGPCFVGCAVV